MQETKTVSLKKELLRKRTIFSFILSFGFIAFFFSQTSFEEVSRTIKDVDPLFLALAFFCHYISFLFRGERWKRMLRPAGFSGTLGDVTKIVFLLQSVDCILPAKLGDVYGAHLMKINFALTRSFAFGSIVLWRLADLVVVAMLGVLSAFVIFQQAIPAELLTAGKIVIPLLGLVLLLIAIFYSSHEKLISYIPSEKIRTFLNSFRQGLQVNKKLLPSLFISTILIWSVEAFRFYFICKAMAVELNFMAVMFVILFAMLFTAVPFTPAGLGAVELGMVKLLQLVGITGPIVYPLIIWDRIISHWSQVLLGVIFVLFSKPINLKIWHSDENMSWPSEQEPNFINSSADSMS